MKGDKFIITYMKNISHINFSLLLSLIHAFPF